MADGLEKMRELLKPWEPTGQRFIDATYGEMILVEETGTQWDGWLAYRHPDGQWVSLRKATNADLALLGRIRL